MSGWGITGVVVGSVGALLAIWGTFQLWRIKPGRFDRDMQMRDFGGGRVLAEYVALVQNPTAKVMVGTMLQLLGLLVTAAASV